jgi:hypothetical protein
MSYRTNNSPSPLSQLVGELLARDNMRPSEFCRSTNFDQGLMSKVLCSRVSKVGFESALKLAVGFGEPPSRVFAAMGREEWSELLRQAWARENGLIRASEPYKSPTSTKTRF